MNPMKKYSDVPVDQSKEFKESGMVLVTDPRADKLMEKAKKQNEK